MTATTAQREAVLQVLSAADQPIDRRMLAARLKGTVKLGATTLVQLLVELAREGRVAIHDDVQTGWRRYVARTPEPAARVKKVTPSAVQRAVVAALKKGPLTTPALAHALDMPPQRITNALHRLALRGVVVGEVIPGHWKAWHTVREDPKPACRPKTHRRPTRYRYRSDGTLRVDAPGHVTLVLDRHDTARLHDYLAKTRPAATATHGGAA